MKTGKKRQSQKMSKYAKAKKASKSDMVKIAKGLRIAAK